MDKNSDKTHGSELKPHWSLFIVDGDAVAFKKIYLHYYHYLTFIALKKGLPTSKTKDTLNELFLHIWENQSNLEHVRDHHNYLVTAFLRKLYKKDKSVLHEYVLSEDIPELFLTASVETDYLARNTQQHLSIILDKFISKLPHRQRSLIYQKFYLGLSYQEIAQSNGISVNTVYNTVYNALDKLKILMGKEQLQALSLALLALSAFFYFFFIKQ